MAKEFSNALFRHLNMDNPEQFYSPALTVIEASVAITDLVFDSPEDEGKQLIDEFILMQSLFIGERVKQLTEKTKVKQQVENEQIL